MREIKFRAWDGAKMHENVSPWRHDFVISNTWHRCEKSSGTGIFGSGGDYAEMLVPAVRFTELMQFIGRNDKNGKEIYEGDIVRYKHEYIHRMWDHEAKAPQITEGIEKVVFRGGAFRIGYICNDLARLPEFIDRGDNLHGVWSDRYYDFEIIGNIYENPELIK